MPVSAHAVSYSAGRFSQAVTFAGADYINMGNVSDSAKTVSFWAKPNSTTQKFLELNGAAYVEVSSGTVSATGFTSPTIYVDGVAATAIANTNWHHIAVTTGTSVNANQVNIGKIGTTYFSGLIDSVRIYNRALSASEIAAHYSLGRGAHDNYAAKIKLAADDSNSYLDESLTSGSDYLLSYWYKMGEDNINPINFTISGSAPIAAEQALTYSADWQKYEVAFEADQTGAHLFKFIQNGATAGNSIVYTDNFRLDANSVNKGGMEGTELGSDPYYPTGWTAMSGGKTPNAGDWDVVIDEKYTGSQSFKGMSITDETDGYYQSLSGITSGNWYTLSFWAKTQSGISSPSFTLGTWIRDEWDGGTVYTTLYVSNPTSWTKYSSTFQINDNTPDLIILGNDSASAIFWIDDISLVELNTANPSTTTPSPTASSYDTGKWNDTLKSFLIDGGDSLRYNASGAMPNDAGTISIWWKPNWDYNKFDQNTYLFNSESASTNLIRVFYNKTNYYYTAQLYNGANWTTAVTNSAAQTFSEDSWQHIVVSYDNDVGGSAGSVALYVNGAASGTPYSSTNWTAQTVPDYFYPGSLFGASANTNQADGLIDDIRIYSGQSSAANVNAIYGINPNPPTGATWKKNLVAPIIGE